MKGSRNNGIFATIVITIIIYKKMKNDGFTLRKRLRSFKYAFNGIKLLIAHEPNAWIHCVAAACVLTVIVLVRKLREVGGEGARRFNKYICRDLIITSIPIILQNSFVSVGNLFVQKKINLISYDAAAGFTTAFKLCQIANVGVSTMTNGLANFCSQNKAAGEYKRIKVGYLAVLVYAMITSLIFLVLCELLPLPLTMAFIDNPTQEAIDCSILFLQIVSAFLPVVCVKIVSDGAVRGCGGNLGFTISTFTDLILRVIFVYILVDAGMGFAGVCWAWAIGWSISMFIALGFYIAIPCLRKNWANSPRSRRAEK